LESAADDVVEDSPLGIDSDDSQDVRVTTTGAKGEVKSLSGPNPVVWMDLSVAGKPRGRIYFELFKDVAPQAAENFRRLCAGFMDDGTMVGYKGTEFHNIYAGKFAEGGDISQSVDLPAVEKGTSSLRHVKGGLLTVAPGSSSGASGFQLTFQAMPELDEKQVVFGQMVRPEEKTPQLHVMHWVEAVATSSGVPREAVVVDACGESDEAEADRVLGAMVRGAQMDGTLETQDERFSRVGPKYGRLQDSLNESNLAEVLDLTEDVLEHVEWQAKKAKSASNKARRSEELEASLKTLVGVLEDAVHKAGEVQGFDNKLGRNAKSQLARAEDLEKALNRLY